MTGNGSGVVSSTPPLVSCSTGTCNYQAGTGYSYQLQAQPAISSTFTGWSGDCTGTGDCSILMSGAKSVTANFALKTYTVTVSLSGAGTVSSSPEVLTCNGSSCSGTFNHGTTLRLTPQPAAGNALSGWGGACTGLGACTITLAGDINVSAAFGSGRNLDVTLIGNGGGTINSNPSGISCTSGTCSYSFPTGENVILFETPSMGSLFSGWAGICSGTGICSFSMDEAKTVSATLTAAPKAKVGSKSFSSLQAAYNDATTLGNAVIKLVEGTLPGSFNAGRNILVYIEGGYNAAYSSISTDTTIESPVVIKSGTVVVKGINIR
jgi:hypothetical protein